MLYPIYGPGTQDGTSPVLEKERLNFLLIKPGMLLAFFASLILLTPTQIVPLFPDSSALSAKVEYECTYGSITQQEQR